VISQMGSTGNSTGPHLHFTIKKNDVSLDPLKFIW
jgi:murein DD-endopeptidase MepM/ murein hydrolase activator NlpD